MAACMFGAGDRILGQVSILLSWFLASKEGWS